jgi:hypothetical protein
MSETVPVVTEEKKEESILDKVTSAFSTATATPNPEGVGPEIEEVPMEEPAVVSTDTEAEAEAEPVTDDLQMASVSEPFVASESEITPSVPVSEVTPPVFAPLDAASMGTKKKRKNSKKKCKCPTKKDKKLPKCKRGSQRSKTTKKCKSKRKCAKGTRRDPDTGVCKAK